MRRLPLLVILAAWIAACGTENPPLRVGVLIWPPYELAYLAEHQGYFDSRNIQLVDYQTPAEVTRAYRYGLIDAFFLTTQFALPATRQLKGARIAYVIDFSVGGDALLSRPEIDELGELEGRRIGVEASPLGGYMLQRALDFAALSKSDITLEYVDTPDHVDAYGSGLVDAVITYEPYRSRIKAMGARELFSSRHIPGEIVDVLIVPERLLESRERDLRRFVGGVEQARLFLAANPENALPIMARRERLSPTLLKQALEGVRLISLEENREMLTGENPTLRTLLNKQSRILMRAGLVPKTAGFDQLIDPRLVEERPQ